MRRGLDMTIPRVGKTTDQSMDDRGRLLLASLIIDERRAARDPIFGNAHRRPICAPGMDRVPGGVIIHARTGHGPSFVPVAQLDRASASGAEGYRFDSCRGYSSSSHPLAPMSTTSSLVSPSVRSCEFVQVRAAG